MTLMLTSKPTFSRVSCLNWQELYIWSNIEIFEIMKLDTRTLSRIVFEPYTSVSSINRIAT